MPKISAARAPAPSTVPGTSTRPAPGSALSGRIMAATSTAARPKVTSNNMIPRQLHTPTSAPPRTGPSASEKPDTAAQTPSARLRLRSSAYSCLIMDSVPGSLAAAPSPITARPAIRIAMLGASADIVAPAQYTPAPASITFLRPNSSPTMPNPSIRAAKVSAYAPTTHCSDDTPACRSDLMLASATLTTVLSRKVRNSSVHKVASASGRRRQRAPATRAGTATAPVILTAAGRGEPMELLAVGLAQQAAEAARGDQPPAVDVDRGA